MTEARRSGAAYRIGLVSDTHGELPDAATTALAGVDAIVHAGDIGGGSVVELLEAIAPVIAVHGNNRDASESRFPAQVAAFVGGVRLVVAHQEADLVRSRAATRPGTRVAVTGHTHMPSIQEADGVLWVNPGSPSSPRKGAPAAVAIVTIGPDGAVSAEIVTLP